MELVSIADFGQVPTRFSEDILQVKRETLVKDLLDQFTHGLLAAEAHHFFKRRIAASYPAVFIDGKQADVYRFDYRFIKLFQQCKLFGMLLLLSVKPAVFNRDGDITRNRSQDLKILGRQKRAVACPAQTDDGNHLAARHARHEIMELLAHDPLNMAVAVAITVAICRHTDGFDFLYIELIGPDHAFFG